MLVFDGRWWAEQYALLISGIVPRPVAFVSTLSEDGVENLAPFRYARPRRHHYIMIPRTRDRADAVTQLVQHGAVPISICPLLPLTHFTRIVIVITSSSFCEYGAGGIR